MLQVIDCCYAGVGFPGFPHPVFPSMDAMANAPFDNVINHLNTVTHQLAHVHHQMHQQMHHFHHNNVPQPLPPPQFHNVHNLNQFHRDMMTHNMRIHQAMYVPLTENLNVLLILLSGKICRECRLLWLKV